MDKDISHYVCLIPNSNQEFEDIESLLAELRVGYESRDVYKKSSDCFSRVYRIPVAEAIKLPFDAKGPFLPVDDVESGHGLILDIKGRLWQRYLDNELMK